MFHGIKSMQMTLGWSAVYILMSQCVLEYLKLKNEQINEKKICVQWENHCRMFPC